MIASIMAMSLSPMSSNLSQPTIQWEKSAVIRNLFVHQLGLLIG